MDESASTMSQVKNDIISRISKAITKAKEKGDLPGYVETEIKIETLPVLSKEILLPVWPCH